jgi:hypothetical protein
MSMVGRARNRGGSCSDRMGRRERSDEGHGRMRARSGRVVDLERRRDRAEVMMQVVPRRGRVVMMW